MVSVFVGLGSNLNNPLQQLRQALHQLQQLPQTRFIDASTFYRSCAVGPGDQPDYINAVAHLKTELAAESLLDLLQQIEHNQGRVRGPVQWQPRTLDLDILLYGHHVINTPRLQVPHPRLSERNFVTQPLLELAPTLELPNGHKLAALNQQLGAQGLWPLKCPKFIAIEGPIGAGKTTLAKQLARTLGANTLFEGHEENPFLVDFYDAPERWALATQLFFFTQRLEQIKAVQATEPFALPWVADFSMIKDRLFAELTLSAAELRLYDQVCLHTLSQLPQPDCLIYCYAPTEILLQRIQQRGRTYERPIQAQYLSQLSQAYEKLLVNYASSRIIRVNTAEVNLAESTRDYEKFVEYILSDTSGNERFTTQTAE